VKTRLKTGATLTAALAMISGTISLATASAHADTLSTYRVDTASGALTDSSGNVWSAEQGFVGGRAATPASATTNIAGTADDALYRTGVFGMTGFKQAVANGTYDVTLKMAENYWTTAGSRVFNVTAEGLSELQNVDIFAAVGKNAAYDRTFRVVVSDGELDLGFTAVKDHAIVSAIQIAQVDTTPVVVTLGTAPAQNAVLTSTSASFAFTANKSNVTFTCKLDSGATAACTSPANYSSLAVGQHTFTVSATDSWGNVSAPVARTWTIQAPAPSQPGPTNTGVPAGVVLKASYGNMNIKTAGTVISGLDIHGFVAINAPNVTIKDCIIRGGVATGNIGLVQDVNSIATNFLIEDSELVPEYPSVWIDAIKGWNYTAVRINAHGTVDTAKVYGDNTTIKSSWLHDTQWYASDPNQGGGPTHNDGVQVLSGNNIHILNNTITGSNNSAMQVTQDHGPVSNLFFENNWADNGGCSVNLAAKPLAYMDGITVSYNQFGNHTRIANCAIISGPETQLTAVQNYWWGTTTLVTVTKGT